jgi:predicted HTH transcriptional regulator
MVRQLEFNIRRTMGHWQEIDFVDARDVRLFTSIALGPAPATHQVTPKSPRRFPTGSQESSQESSQKSSQKIIELMRNNSRVTIAELARQLGVSDRTIKKQIAKLKEQKTIRRVGPDRGGRWEVSE